MIVFHAPPKNASFKELKEAYEKLNKAQNEERKKRDNQRVAGNGGFLLIGYQED